MVFKTAFLIDPFLTNFGLQQVVSPIPVALSVQNENYRITTNKGPFFLRFYPPGTNLSNIQREHRVLKWGSLCNLPTYPPLLGLDGKDIYQVEDRYGTLFPLIEAQPIVRGRITEQGATLLGEMQGRLHATFAQYQDRDLPEGGSSSSWDTKETLQILDRVEKNIKQTPKQVSIQMIEQESVNPEEFSLVFEILTQQRKWLESGMAHPRSDFHELPLQPVHGDYHDGNVLLDAKEEKVVAVVDFEMVGRLPRVFELIRAIYYMFLFEPPLLTAYMKAYRKHIDLTAQECELGIEMWWQSVLHDTWAVQQRFFYQNHRVVQYFPQMKMRLFKLADPRYREQFAQSLKA